MPFNDPTTRHIESFKPALAARAIILVNAARDAGVPIYISSGRRSVFEQAKLVAKGASKTMKSKHLTGEAFDIDIVGLNRNQIPKDWLLALGQFGEALGLKWGGRFKNFYDGGHFEI